MSLHHSHQAPVGGPGVGETRAAMASLFGLIIVTVVWWCLALWPVAGVPPTWLLRTRQVCFNAGPSGLPDATGWLLLLGQPLGMLAVLMVIAGDGVRNGLRSARGSLVGRLGMGITALVLVVGSVSAVVRVRNAVGDAEWADATLESIPASYPRLDQEPPLLGLVDQFGDVVKWDSFKGSPLLVTFGFGHCQTVCPLMVQNALRAQEALKGDGIDVPLLVITLDPWRDTPSRLPHLAEQFMLGSGDRILSGPVEEVNRVLDALSMNRERVEATGDIVHPTLVYILDSTGTIAYAATGHTLLIEELLRRL